MTFLMHYQRNAQKTHTAARVRVGWAIKREHPLTGHNLQVYIPYFESDLQELIAIHSLDECLAVALAIIWSTATILQAQFTQFLQKPQQPDFHFKIFGFLAAVKLTDKSGYPDNGYANTSVGYLFLIAVGQSTHRHAAQVTDSGACVTVRLTG